MPWARTAQLLQRRADSRQRQEIFLFSTASRPALGPTQRPIQWVPWALSPGVNRSGREADHSPPSRPRMVELHFHSSYVFMAWRLIKHRDNFTFFPFLMWIPAATREYNQFSAVRTRCCVLCSTFTIGLETGRYSAFLNCEPFTGHVAHTVINVT
jgi:hypothetical protein